MNKLVTLILLTLAILIKSDEIPFNDCGSTYDLFNVDIEDCKALPCVLYIGTEKTISMNYRPNSASEYLVQKVEVILRGVHTNVKVTPEDPCFTVGCPITHNNNASFSAVMSITDDLVPLAGFLSWTIKNQEGVDVICMHTDVVIDIL